MRAEMKAEEMLAAPGKVVGIGRRTRRQREGEDGRVSAEGCGRRGLTVPVASTACLAPASRDADHLGERPQHLARLRQEEVHFDDVEVCAIMLPKSCQADGTR